MKKNSIKTILKTISIISLILTGLLYIAYRFFDFYSFEQYEVREIIIIIYLASTLYYNKLEINDKNEEIASLKYKLKEKGQ